MNHCSHPIKHQENLSEIYLNPALTTESLPSTWEGYNNLSGHYWVTTSGTTGAVKWVALSKEAFKVSARAVNLHLRCTSKDIWINPLPTFHVGGLAIHERARLSGSEVCSFNQKWDPLAFVSSIERHQGTLTSVVPTQLYDLVEANLKPPPSLRGIIVGGGKCSDVIYEKAVALNWPLILTYGLSECSSQVATAQPGDKKLKLLSHIEAKISDQGLLYLKSPALLTGYLQYREDKWCFWDPKIEGWFQTEDGAEISNSFLTFTGRKNDMIKVVGENVNLHLLQELFFKMTLAHNEMFLLAVPDERLGHKLISVTTQEYKAILDQYIKRFNQNVMPYEKVREVHTLPFIPKTPLGKCIVPQVLAMLLKKEA